MMRPPDSLQGQVPQVLYDWLKDLYNDYAQVSTRDEILRNAQYGADDSGGVGYRLIRVPN